MLFQGQWSKPGIFDLGPELQQKQFSEWNLMFAWKDVRM